jgi:hypothetical protein
MASLKIGKSVPSDREEVPEKILETRRRQSRNFE